MCRSMCLLNAADNASYDVSVTWHMTRLMRHVSVKECVVSCVCEKSCWQCVVWCICYTTHFKSYTPHVCERMRHILCVLSDVSYNVSIVRLFALMHYASTLCYALSSPDALRFYTMLRKCYKPQLFGITCLIRVCSMICSRYVCDVSISLDAWRVCSMLWGGYG